MRQFTKKGEVPFDPSVLTALVDRKYVAVDTETAGLDRRAPVRLVQFAVRGLDPVAFAPESSEDTALLARTVQALRWPLFFNAPFDLGHLLGWDVTAWPEYVDVRLAWKTARPDLEGGLKALARDVLYRVTEDETELKATMRANKWTWENVPVEALIAYGLSDAEYTSELWAAWRTSPAVSKEVLRVEHEVQRLMAAVGARGFRFDTERALALKQQYEARIADAEARLLAEAGMEAGTLNPASVPQVKEVMARLGLPTESTSRTALQNVSHPFVEALMEWRTYRKWIASYLDPCIESAVNGRVHAEYQSFGARTGRMSCSNPPLQQMPTRASKDVRECFLADSRQEHVVSIDYDQIELRLAAAFSGDRVLVQAFGDGTDPYQATANELGTDRHTAKTLMLGALYGAGPAKISTILRVPLAEAKSIHRRFWKVHAGLHEWVQAAQQQTRPRTWYGRVLAPLKAYHTPNAVIQGTAADILKRGLMAVSEHAPHMAEAIRAVIHDELVFSMDLRQGSSPIHQVLGLIESVIEAEAKVDIKASYTIYGARWGQPRSDSGNTQSSS